MQYVGNQLKKILKERKITQENFSKMVNSSHVTINKICNGGDTSIDFLGEISKILNVPIVYFFDEKVLPVPLIKPKTLEEKYIEALEEIRALHNELKNLKK